MVAGDDIPREKRRLLVWEAAAQSVFNLKRPVPGVDALRGWGEDDRRSSYLETP